MQSHIWLTASNIYALQRQFSLYIPFLGIARPQPQFPHSGVCERFIYSQDRSTLFPPAEKADPSWEYIIRSQTHECGNWDWGPDIPFLGIFVSNFQHFDFAVWLHSRISSYIRNPFLAYDFSPDPFRILLCLTKISPQFFISVPNRISSSDWTGSLFYKNPRKSYPCNLYKISHH